MGDVTSSLIGGVTGTLTKGIAGSVSSKAGGSLIKIASNSVVRTIANNVNWGSVLSHAADTMGFSRQQRIEYFSRPISKLSTGPSVYDTSVSEDHFIPPTLLPAQFFDSDAEINEQRQRWAAFAVFMSKPFNYGSLYKITLLELDQLGAINLARTTRDQIPGLQINYCCVLFINSYEGEQHSLGSEPLSDALIMARVFIERKYRVFYFYDATPIEYYRWMSWLIDNVDLQLVSYFSGRATQIPDYTGKEKDGLLEVLQFTNEAKRIQNKGERIPNVSGFTNDTMEDTVVYELIRQKAYPQKRIILLTDYKFNQNQFKDEIPFQKLQTLSPLPNVIYIGCGQTWTPGRNAGSRIMTTNNPGLFSWYFSQVLRWFKNTNFNQLYSEFSQDKCQKQMLQVFAGDPNYLLRPIIVSMGHDDEEIQLYNITQYLGGRNPAQIVSIPPVDIPSKVEIQIAQQRWNQFTSEMKKNAPYQSEYKELLQKLDQMGCINLDRIYRQQIPPNIQIYNCLALFVCPYEGLPNTLDDGPVNDGVLMAQLFLSKGYNVVYICDPTPHQYYKWMDWLLSYVKLELISYFSGHGGQTKDKTGLEADGMSEVMFFYSAQLKKGPNKEQQFSLDGITDRSVVDTVMHDLVISKDYPKTRVVLLSDCCHSGTMFNLDQPWPPKGKLVAPVTKRLNIIHVGAAVDSQTAKQKSLDGIVCGAFTYSLCNLIKSNPKSTFKDLEAYCLRNIKKDQVVQLTATDMNNLDQQIIITKK